MSSPAPPQQPYTHLSSDQIANFIYWLNGLAPVVTNIVTPFITFLAMYWKRDKTLLQKYNQQVNEIGRQLVSGTIGLVSYFGGGELTRCLLNIGVGPDSTPKLDSATRQIAMTVGGVTTSFLGFAILRPLLSTDLICKFLKHEGAEEIHFSPQEMRHHLEKGVTALESIDQRMAEIIREKRASLMMNRDQYTHGFFGPIQHWVDRHLVPSGVPKLGKTAAYATATLTVYLGGLTALLWGINRLLGKTPTQTQLPGVNPLQMASQLQVANYPIPFQNPRLTMQARPYAVQTLPPHNFSANYALPWR